MRVLADSAKTMAIAATRWPRVRGGRVYCRLLTSASGSEIVDLGGSKRPPATAKPIGKGGGLRPPFPLGLAGAVSISEVDDFRPGSKIKQPKLSSSHIRMSDFSFDGGTEHVTEWHSNWSPGPILGACCTIFRAGPVWEGLGAQFGGKTTPNRPKLKIYILFHIMTATK